jgi:hypothetical protein
MPPKSAANLTVVFSGPHDIPRDGGIPMISGVRVTPREGAMLAMLRAVPRRLLAVALAMLTTIVGTANAQTTTGSIRGYVRGGNAAPITEAQISARNVELGQTRAAVTNSSGFYNIPGLRPGQYEVTVRRLGFTAQSRTIAVPIAQTVTFDVQLQEAATQLSAVTVTTDAAQTAQTSEIGTNVSREQIQSLPTFDRNFLDLARLAPGITATAVNNSDKVIASGGQPPEAVNLFIDGATYKNDVLKGGVAGQDASKGNPFPQGAVQEFRVITQNYKAEYQKAGSAIITATTRSGGNAWEADVFAFGIGKSYVARDAVSQSRGDPRPSYERLQAGGSLGGPIAKDKLFFFGTYELNARDQPEVVRLGGDSAKVPAALLNTFRPYLGQFTSEFREHLGFGKLTWAQSARSTVDASVTVRTENDFRGFGGKETFDFAEDVAIAVYTGVGNWRYAGDRWLNEAQVNVQNFTWNPRPKNPNLVGREYRDVIRIGGRAGTQDFTQNRISLRNDVTRSGIQAGGDHVFKGGVSVDFLSYEAEKNQVINPIFRFRSDELYARPFEAEFGFGDPRIKTDNQQVGAYLQDDWSIGRKLVLNLGVRWDFETNMINNDYVTPQPLRDSLLGPLRSQFSNLDRPVLKANGTCCDVVKVNVVDGLGGLENFVTTGRSDRPIFLGAWQPRFGASYDLLGDGRTVLFGGAGIYYDRTYWNTLFDEQYRRQFQVLRVEFRNTCGPTAPPNCAVWNESYFNPATLRTLAGTTGLPEVFLVKNDLKTPKTYQYSGGVRQTVGPALVTLTYNGVRGHNRMNFIHATPWGGLGPNYATAFVTDDRVKTWYDAMQLQIDRPLRATRWGGSLAYTLARSEEQGQTQSGEIFWGFDDHYPTVPDIPRRRAPGNQTHQVVANGIVRLPYEFHLSSVVTLGSGLTSNATNASGGFGYGLETKYVYSPPTRPFLGIGHVFNTQNVDLRLEKTLTLGGAQNVSVLADLFNAFGNANYGCFGSTIEVGGVPARDYNKPGCAALGRRLQVGLRYGLRPMRGAQQGQ